MARTTRHDAPRFLRFACAIALTSVAGGAAAGCYTSHEGAAVARDGGPRRDARVAVADAPPTRDTFVARPDVPVGRPDVPFTCLDCACAWGEDTGPTPSCDALGLWECCAVIGPLAPPDLPA